MAILITGGTGLIGSRLCEWLTQKGYTIHIFTRDANERTNTAHIKYFVWDTAAFTYDAAALQGVTAIINLAGAGIADERWTEKRKKEIIDSRVNAARLLIKAMEETPNTVETVINASAQGWYGADTAASLAQRGFTEDMPPAPDFLGEACRQWEASIQPVKDLDKRLVIFRFTMVLSNKGGYLQKMVNTLKAGVAPVLGNGRQIVSWIHIDDLCGLLTQAVENDSWQGVYNAASPQPVSQRTLVTAVGKARRKGFIRMPVPKFVLKIMTGEMSVEVVKSVTVNNQKAAAKYPFVYTTIESAANNLFSPK